MPDVSKVVKVFALVLEKHCLFCETESLFMKNLLSRTLTGFGIFTILLISCQKDSDLTPSNSDYLVQSSWKFEKATASGTDVSSQIPACFKDNTITFSSNGSGTISEGASVCSPAAPATFTWSFQNNDAELNLSAPLITGGSGTFNLVTLNATNLVIAQNMTIPPSTSSILVELTLKH